MPWTPNLSVGVPTIDDQHKMCFEKAEKLYEAGMNGKSKEYISELIDFLEDYTKEHFADEEAYMLSINYPGYYEQKQAHVIFIDQIQQLRDEYNATGGNIAVIINANSLVLNWLVNHISNLDKKIGQYVSEKK